MAAPKQFPLQISKMGRPSLFTEQVRKKILDAVRMGNYDYVAAQAAGVPERTYRRWLKRGREEEEGEYADFWQEVTKAEKEAETKIVAGVVASGAGDPKNWQWWLERKCPERWGRDTFQIKQLEKELNELKAQVQVVLGGSTQKNKKAKA